MGFNQFFARFSIFAFLSLLVVWGLFYVILQNHPPLTFWLGWVYLYIVYLGIHAFLLKASGDRPQRFMAATAVKIFFILIFLVIIGFLDRPNLHPVGIAFAFFYLVFTIVEVVELLKVLNKG